MKRLILGNGLLGSCIQEKTNWDFMSRQKDNFDLTIPSTYFKNLLDYDEIINCVAHTKTYDEDRDMHWKINFEAVSYLTDFCKDKNKKLIHISTDYIYSNSINNASELDVPVHCRNWYGYTKLLGDGYVQLKSNNYLIIRCSHKPEPFPYEFAFINQIGNFDYVSKISDLIIALIEANCSGIYNVGTELKTMYDLALKTKTDIKPTMNLPNETTPRDVTMNLNKLYDIR